MAAGGGDRASTPVPGEAGQVPAVATPESLFGDWVGGDGEAGSGGADGDMASEELRELDDLWSETASTRWGGSRGDRFLTESDVDTFFVLSIPFGRCVS